MPNSKLSEALDLLVDASKRIIAPDSLFKSGEGYIESHAVARSALDTMLDYFNQPQPPAERFQACFEVWGRKAHRVAMLQLLAICQRICSGGAPSGDAGVVVALKLQYLGAGISMLVSGLIYHLIGCSGNEKCAGVGLEVIHYIVRMDALEAFSMLLCQEPAPEEAARLDPRSRLQCIRQGGLFLMDAALQAAQLAQSYTAKCNACSKTGCCLTKEVHAALERSQLFEHVSRSLLHDAAAQLSTGRPIDEELLTDLRYLGEAGQRLVRSRLPPRQAELQQLSKVAAGPCWQYVLALQVVQMLHAADRGPLYGLLPGAALLPLLPADETDPEHAISPAAAEAAMARKLREFAAAKASGCRNAVAATRAAVDAGSREDPREDGAANGPDKGAAAATGPAPAAASAAGSATASAADAAAPVAGGAGSGAAHAASAGSVGSMAAKLPEGGVEGVELLDTVFAETAIAIWMSSHDPQRYAPPLYDDDDGAELAPPQEARPKQQQQQQGKAEQPDADQAEQQGSSSGGASAPPADAAARRAEKLAELRAFQSLPPPLSRRAIYTLCVRIVNACIASARTWEQQRAAQQRQPLLQGASTAGQSAAGGPAKLLPPATNAPVQERTGDAMAPVAAVGGATDSTSAITVDAVACIAPAPVAAGADPASASQAPVPAVDAVAAGGSVRRLIPENTCIRLALDALECAAFLMRRRPPPPQPGGGGGEADLEELDELYDSFDAASYLLSMAMGGARTGKEALPRPLEWWRAAVEMMNLAVSRGLRDPAVWDDQFRLRMLRVRLPPLPAVLPPTAPLNVSRALEAGVLPCMERALRRAAPIQAANPYRLESLLNLVLAWPNMGWLLAYGDPQQAAALVATVGKLLRQQAAAAAAATTRDGAGTSSGRAAVASESWRAWEPVCKFGERLLSTGLSMWAWLEQQDAPPAPAPLAAAAAAATAEAKAIGQDEVVGEGAEPGNEVKPSVADAPGPGPQGAEEEDEQPAPAAAPAAAEAALSAAKLDGMARFPRLVPGSPSRQLAQMVAAATALWLPALSELARGLTGGNLLEGKDAMSLGRVAVNWAMAMTRTCARAQQAAAAAAAVAAAPEADAALRAAAAEVMAEAEAAAEGYRELLFYDVRYVDLLCEFGRSLDGSWIPQTMLRSAAPLVRRAMKQVENLRDAISRAHAVVLGDAVVHLAETFPDTLREELIAAAGGATVASNAAAAAAITSGGGAAPAPEAASSSGRGGKGRGGSKRRSDSGGGAAAAPTPAAVMVPAAPLVMMLQGMMAPGCLAPRPHVLAKLDTLFATADATGAAAGANGSAGSSKADGGGASGSAAGGSAATAAAAAPVPEAFLELPELAPLLPPRSGLALLPRTCAYPRCCSLEGDSELFTQLRVCTGCRRTCYCRRECQLSHWRSHKAACVAWQAQEKENASAEQGQAQADV